MASSRANIKCGLCRRGREVEDICGPLHESDDCNAHHKCMQYSAKLVQYKFSSFGGFKIKEVQQEIARGKPLKCYVCKTGANGPKFKKMGGATSGCAIEKCRRSYHFFCAEKADNVTTRRIEVVKKKNDKDKKVVMYRVFCSEEHLKKYEKDVKNESYLTDSDSSDSEEGEEDSTTGDEDGFNTLQSQGSNTNGPVTTVTKSNSPKGFRFQTKRKTACATTGKPVSSEDSSSSFENILHDLQTRIDNSDDDFGGMSDARTSGTSAKDLRSQQLFDDSSSNAGSSDGSSVNLLASPAKQYKDLSDETSFVSNHVKGNRSNLIISDSSSVSSGYEKSKKINNNLKEEQVVSRPKEETECVGLLGTITTVSPRSGIDWSSRESAEEWRKMDTARVVLTDIDKKHTAVNSPKSKKNGIETMKEGKTRLHRTETIEPDRHISNSSRLNKSCSTDLTGSKSRRPSKKHIREPGDEDDEDEPTTKKAATGEKLHGKKDRLSMSATVAVTTRDENESEGYGSAAECSDRRGVGPTVPLTQSPHKPKRVNSKVPKSVNSPNRQKAPSEDCVLCFLEREDHEAVPNNQYISQIATQLFGVTEDGVYLWKFKADDAQITSGHMVYFMKDLSKAVRNKDFEQLSSILCDLEGESVHKYDTAVEFNEDYGPELQEELYYKLKESIKENLAHACEKLGKNIGSIHYFKSLKTHVVFLYLSDILDEKRAIRNRLGHKNKLFVWSPDDEDIEFAYPTLTSQTRNTIRNNEYEVLLRWIKSHIKRPKLLVRPNTKEPYLQVERRSSITCRVRTMLEELCSDAHEAVDMITIGPVNKEIISVWPYLQHCIPTVIEERLTALKDIFLVYDVDSRTVGSMQCLVPRLPSHVDYKVLCGQDPSTTPISCILLQVSLNQENVSSTSRSSCSESISMSSSSSSPEETRNRKKIHPKSVNKKKN